MTEPSLLPDTVVQCLLRARQCRAAALRSERPYVAKTFRMLAQEWVAEGKYYRDVVADEAMSPKGSDRDE